MDIYVDGELESLLGMFNFDQYASSKEERPRDEMLSLSSLYSDHHQNYVLSSDHHPLLVSDMLPLGAIGILPTMRDSWDQNHLQDTATLKRKQVNIDNIHSTNSKFDVKRQEVVKAKKKQRVSPESPRVDETNTNWIDSKSVSNSSNNDKSSVTSVKGKTRATKGTASDPQSLYARKRREKISERLRTLQNLVPNGTKVDISTMLEEAVNYVKFLQLQIKLLSSDDLWMYAPLAYNGLDMGFHHNLLSRLM